MQNTAVRTTVDLARDARARWEQQRGFDELGRPLRDITFCVVDLETTGASVAQGAKITEIGAVKIRGGEVLGEFQTLVNPREEIPAFITVLTGITTSMVAEAPGIDAALPAFLEFAQGCVLVAHNAPFDVGFLQHFAREQHRPWPSFEVVDTARLARRVITRDDAPNCKLSSLAQLFGATTTPDHRALHDARATVDVLHGLFGRLGSLGVQTLEELQEFSSRVSPAQRRKRHLADHLPHAPGVYLFVDEAEHVLYVGTSRDLRTRVRSYFTTSETRTRIGEMIGIAEAVKAVECATALEARVRELRLIAEHKPRYNRRSRFPERTHFLKLTNEAWPRLSMVTRVLDDDATYLGPLGSRRVAERCLAALHETFGLRQCSGRLPRSPSGTACVLAEMGRCLSPCDGSVPAQRYSAEVEAVRLALVGDPRAVVDHVTERMEGYAAQERFEEASTHRDRLASLVKAASRTQRLVALTRCPEIVAAHRQTNGRWAVHVVRYGRLAAAGLIPAGHDAHAYVASLRAGAETVRTAPGPVPAASAEESEALLGWLEQDGVRLVRVDGEWTWPTAGAARHRWITEAEGQARAAASPFERRTDATVHRPAR